MEAQFEEASKLASSGDNAGLKGISQDQQKKLYGWFKQVAMLPTPAYTHLVHVSSSYFASSAQGFYQPIRISRCGLRHHLCICTVPHALSWRVPSCFHHSFHPSCRRLAW